MRSYIESWSSRAGLESVVLAVPPVFLLIFKKGWAGCCLIFPSWQKFLYVLNPEQAYI